VYEKIFRASDCKNFFGCTALKYHHSFTEIGTDEYFYQVEQCKYFVEPHIPRFVEFDRWKNKKALEIWCANRYGQNAFCSCENQVTTRV